MTNIKKILASLTIFAAIMTVALLIVSAGSSDITVELSKSQIEGQAKVVSDDAAANGSFVEFGNDNAAAYQQHLNRIKQQPWRNTNEDDSVTLKWSMQQLDADIDNLLQQSRTDYDDGGFAEQYVSDAPPYPWRVTNAGNAAMRTGCEFSHFAYDDPIIFPGQPEAAHLHMFFGNTDVNAYTTYDSLLNSGGGTCNGAELNRTGYWVPAMFDGKGSVVIPDFLNIYYKNDNIASQNDKSKVPERVLAEPYPVAAEDTWISDDYEGARVKNFEGVQIVTRETQLDQQKRGHQLWKCIWENGSTEGMPSSTALHIDVKCPDQPKNGNKPYLEMNVYFPTCWNGQDPSDWESDNVGLPAGGFYWRDCKKAGYDQQFTGIQYRIRYEVLPGDDTRNWFISSDVSPETLTKTVKNGSSTHGDWWGAWNPTVNQLWIDNCGNELNTACGYGYLDGKPLDTSPNGPTLKYREKYQGKTMRIPTTDIYNSLCSKKNIITQDTQAAYCRPGNHDSSSHSHN
jgi:hypothetical protein